MFESLSQCPLRCYHNSTGRLFMEFKILGTGCPKCKRLEELTRQAAQEANVDGNFEKVTDINDIMSYSITSTPALVINGKVVSSGRVPQKEEIATWIKEAGAGAG